MEWINKKTMSQEKELPWFEKRTVLAAAQKPKKNLFFFKKQPATTEEEYSLLHSEMENLRFAIGLPSSPIENDFEKLKQRQQENIARKKNYSSNLSNLRIYENGSNVFKRKSDNFEKKITKDFSEKTQFTDEKYTYIRINNKDKFKDDYYTRDTANDEKEKLDLKKRIAALQEKIDQTETQPIKIAALKKRKEFEYNINSLKEKYLEKKEPKKLLQQKHKKNIFVYNYKQEVVSPTSINYSYAKDILVSKVAKPVSVQEKKQVMADENIEIKTKTEPVYETAPLYLKRKEPLSTTEELQALKAEKTKNIEERKFDSFNESAQEPTQESRLTQQISKLHRPKVEVEEKPKEKDLSRYRIIVNEEFQNTIPSFDSRSLHAARTPQPMQQEQWSFDPSDDPWKDHKPSLQILRSENISSEDVLKEKTETPLPLQKVSSEKPHEDIPSIKTSSIKTHAKNLHDPKTEENFDSAYIAPVLSIREGQEATQKETVQTIPEQESKNTKNANELKNLFKGEKGKDENLLSKQFSAPSQNENKAIDFSNATNEINLEKKNSNFNEHESEHENKHENEPPSKNQVEDEQEYFTLELEEQAHLHEDNNNLVTPEEIIISQEMTQKEDEIEKAEENYEESYEEKNANETLQDEENEDEDEEIDFTLEAQKTAYPKSQAVKKEEKETTEQNSITPQVSFNKQYFLKLNSLKTNKNKFISDPVEIQNVIAKLEETLGQFNIEGRVVGLQQGPIITRYEIKIPPGIKVSRLLGLTDELAMALEAMKVRIEAPIPGRSTAGIEIPNKKRQTVYLGDIVNDESYKESGTHLPLPFGKDIAGNSVIEDLVNMPHLLIAGATGSGKSVAVNTFITSLILTRTPEEVRFLLVDPKLVELSHYNEIPHLLHPVITDHQKAILALNWAVEEMERRYEDLVELRVRDIRSYNEKAKDKKSISQMPYIVILIDELGDLMMVAGKDVESSIIRLTQKARAVGIHLILATQRPSVDVITALIKANCPARISLQVAQKTDSRTILDGNGAEQLLGKGDMLFRHPSKGQLQRIQCPYVEDYEVEEIVNQVKNMGKASYITLDDPQAGGVQMDPESEEIMDEAWQIILESQKASASYLQRRLRIGYNRAARIIEAFEAKGWIGPQTGSKPREILATV